MKIVANTSDGLRYHLPILSITLKHEQTAVQTLVSVLSF